MSFWATVWAWDVIRDKKPKTTDRLVLLAMADHAHRRSGKCWAAHEILADDTGLHRSTVITAQKRIRSYFAKEMVEDRPGWTTIWKFPTCSAELQVGVGSDVEGVGENDTGCRGERHKPVGNPKGTSRARRTVTMKLGPTPPPGKTHFLDGTGWV